MCHSRWRMPRCPRLHRLWPRATGPVQQKRMYTAECLCKPNSAWNIRGSALSKSSVLQHDGFLKPIVLDMDKALGEQNPAYCYTDEQAKKRYGADEGKESGSEVQICGTRLPKKRAIKFAVLCGVALCIRLAHRAWNSLKPLRALFKSTNVAALEAQLEVAATSACLGCRHLRITRGSCMPSDTLITRLVLQAALFEIIARLLIQASRGMCSHAVWCRQL